MPSERTAPFSPSRPALRPLAALACKRERGLRRLRCGVMRIGRRQRRLCHPRREPIMNSTIGRPRKLTDRQVKIILAWHARYVIWRALGRTLKSQRTLARELGVSQATISYVVRGESTSRCVRHAVRGAARGGVPGPGISNASPAASALP